MSDALRIATLGFVSAISRTILALATSGLVDDEEPQTLQIITGGPGRTQAEKRARRLIPAQASSAQRSTSIAAPSRELAAQASCTQGDDATAAAGVLRGGRGSRMTTSQPGRSRQAVLRLSRAACYLRSAPFGRGSLQHSMRPEAPEGDDALALALLLMS